jgi:predicted metal-dependent phosphoesterase TrpH
VLKVELHAHTDLDPLDAVAHTTEELIDRAAALGYGALAVTPHDRYFDPAPYAAHARARGILLLAGIERTIRHAHVVLVNFPRACETVGAFDEIAALKRAHPHGLVIAPHALFPIRSAVGQSVLDAHADVFDAIEINAMFTRQLDFNTRVVEWAKARGKPLVGNGDVHLLAQLGTTFSLVDAPPEADAICAAIKAGRVTVEMQPLPAALAALHFARMSVVGLVGRAQRLLGRR